MLKDYAANRKRRLPAFPNVSPYIYDVKISGLYKELHTHTHTHIYIYNIYDISRLRVNQNGFLVKADMSYDCNHLAHGLAEHLLR
jgi:hypothetical protein